MKDNLIEKDMFELKYSVVKAITAAVPLIGGSLISLLSDYAAYQGERKLERFEDFLKKLENDLCVVNDKLNQNYISKNDFLDVFEDTARYIVNERSQIKRDAFRNILLNSMTNGCDYDETERYQRIVDNMTEIEFTLINIFHNTEYFVNKYRHKEVIGGEYEHELGMTTITGDSIYATLFPSKNDLMGTAHFLADCLSINKNTILESLYFLIESRLIIITETKALSRVKEEQKSNLDIENETSKNITLKMKPFFYKQKYETYQPASAFLENRLTPKGADFINYITLDIFEIP